jgi:hypothetical protein
MSLTLLLIAFFTIADILSITYGGAWMLIGVIDLILAVAATIDLPLTSKARRR